MGLALDGSDQAYVDSTVITPSYANIQSKPAEEAGVNAFSTSDTLAVSFSSAFPDTSYSVVATEQVYPPTGQTYSIGIKYESGFEVRSSTSCSTPVNWIAKDY
jgi:hypothetical protein